MTPAGAAFFTGMVAWVLKKREKVKIIPFYQFSKEKSPHVQGTTGWFSKECIGFSSLSGVLFRRLRWEDLASAAV